jgi:hypothetical protein
LELSAGIFNSRMNVLILTITFLLVIAPNTVSAKRGDSNRSEFYGIVQERPENALQGKWVIGGRTFITDAGTEFDQSDGKLTVGSCAKVHLRNGRVHEIDSEPMRDCR